MSEADKWEKKGPWEQLRSRQTTYMDGSFEFSSFNGRLVVYASFKGHSLVGIHTFSSEIDNTYKIKGNDMLHSSQPFDPPTIHTHTHAPHQTTPPGPVLVSQFSLSNGTVTTKKQLSIQCNDRVYKNTQFYTIILRIFIYL